MTDRDDGPPTPRETPAAIRAVSPREELEAIARQLEADGRTAELHVLARAARILLHRSR